MLKRREFLKDHLEWWLALGGGPFTSILFPGGFA